MNCDSESNNPINYWSFWIRVYIHPKFVVCIMFLRKATMENVGERFKFSLVCVGAKMVIKQDLQITNFSTNIGRSQAGNPAITNMWYNWQGEADFVRFQKYIDTRQCVVVFIAPLQFYANIPWQPLFKTTFFDVIVPHCSGLDFLT